MRTSSQSNLAKLETKYNMFSRRTRKIIHKYSYLISNLICLIVGECESQPVLEQERKYKDLKERLELFANNEIGPDIIMQYYEEACKCV